MASRPASSGSKTATFTGTGPNGATITGGNILDKQPVSDKPKSNVEPVNGNVLLQGNAVKSVVTYKFDSSEALIFKGKAAMPETRRKTGDMPSKGSVDGPVANVTLVHDAKMCVVSHSVSVKGIIFGGDDDDE